VADEDAAGALFIAAIASSTRWHTRSAQPKSNELFAEQLRALGAGWKVREENAP
jgi:UDP-N-acetylglucosamine enolpyruvyl transferase